MLRFGNRVRPLALAVLYHSRLTPDASPKAISGRTSYHQVRLAFHLYPHLIRDFFNNHRFGPPLDFTRASTWTWIAHLASGLLRATKRRPIKTRFRCGSALYTLNLATQSNSPVHSTKGTRSGCSRIALSRIVSTRFQVLLTPLPGFFSRFPSRYLITIGQEVVFSLG